MEPNWIDRFALAVSPAWGRRRLAERARTALAMRYYDAATTGRRGEGWRRANPDANAALERGLDTLRGRSRDMARNNPYADNAVDLVAGNIVSWGIHAEIQADSKLRQKRAQTLWQAWAGSRACDAVGMLDLYGLQELVARTVVESGEALIRRVHRPLGYKPPHGKPLEVPLQLKVFEPDHLDTQLTGQPRGMAKGARIVQGVELDEEGRPLAYWVFDEHPGANALALRSNHQSRRVPASEILHVFRLKRPSQRRGTPWMSSAMMELRDLAEWKDARLMAAKIAACFAAFVTDPSGSDISLGAKSDVDDFTETLEPGAVQKLSPGQEISFAQPPSLQGDDSFTRDILRAAAGAIGITYEQLNSDYSTVNFSSARMGRIEFSHRRHRWLWQMMIPQMCEGVFDWWLEAVLSTGLVDAPVGCEWTPAALEAIDPEKEADGDRKQLRSGLRSFSETMRAKGIDPERHVEQLASDAALFDKHGLVLDCDPRKTSIAGQKQRLGDDHSEQDDNGDEAK